MARILIVEDEKDIRDVIAFNLKQAGHEVQAVARGEEALAAMAARTPALVLLDVMLPDMSGMDVCRTLKRSPEFGHVPVLMLTARGEEIDRVVGFEVGADDYVVKPFSMRELLLRVQAILRRATGAVPASAVLEFGALRIDKDAHRVWVDGKEIELTALEFKLLLTFYERRNRVQSRGTLLDDVWGLSPDLSTRTVDTHVKRLREKLGPACDYIETVRGVGYRFSAQPEP
jgi:two-component system phosphate regulon response regulator PhoB